MTIIQYFIINVVMCQLQLPVMACLGPASLQDPPIAQSLLGSPIALPQEHSMCIKAMSVDSSYSRGSVIS